MHTRRLGSRLEVAIPVVELQGVGRLARIFDSLARGERASKALASQVESSAWAMPASLQRTAAWLSSKSMQGRKPHAEGWGMRSMALRSREREAKAGGIAQSVGGAGGMRGGGDRGAEFHVEPLDHKADPNALRERLVAAIAGTGVSILNVRIPRTPPSLAKSRYAIVTVGSQEEAMRAVHALNSMAKGSIDGNLITASLPERGAPQVATESTAAKFRGSWQNGGSLAHRQSTEESLMNLLSGGTGS